MSLGFDLFRSSNGAGERIVGAASHLGDVLRDAGIAVSRHASEGARQARSLGDEVLTTSRETARSARSLVEQRPMEALLVVGIAAFAIGWVLRRVKEVATSSDAPTPARRRTTRATARRRTGA
jgi:ElaB/YqjD/DUF883 family membrane-anchored ribosome-binding protein